MGVIPAAWLQPCRMKKIVAHWSAGSHTVSDIDREHYHIIVGGDGALVKGDQDIIDNVDVQDGSYAAHTRACNTQVIGVSMACMLNARERPFDPGPFPMTKAQWDKMVLVIGELCRFYGIPVTPFTVLSHAEVQGNLGIWQRGKWDFTVLPFDPAYPIGARIVGDRMRREVLAAIAAAEAPNDH